MSLVAPPDFLLPSLVLCSVILKLLLRIRRQVGATVKRRKGSSFNKRHLTIASDVHASSMKNLLSHVAVQGAQIHNICRAKYRLRIHTPVKSGLWASAVVSASSEDELK
jgi:hypothetical protein